MIRKWITPPGFLFFALLLALAATTLHGIAPRSNGQPVNGDPPNRSESRTRIANLRGEIGLLQFEHDVDRAKMFEGLKTFNEDMEKVKDALRMTLAVDNESLKEAVGQILQDPEVEKGRAERIQNDLDEAIAKNDRAARDRVFESFLKLSVEVAKKEYEKDIARRKKEFSARLSQIAEKELLLEDELTRYHAIPLQ